MSFKDEDEADRFYGDSYSDPHSKHHADYQYNSHYSSEFEDCDDLPKLQTNDKQKLYKKIINDQFYIYRKYYQDRRIDLFEFFPYFDPYEEQTQKRLF